MNIDKVLIDEEVNFEAGDLARKHMETMNRDYANSWNISEHKSS